MSVKVWFNDRYALVSCCTKWPEESKADPTLMTTDSQSPRQAALSASELSLLAFTLLYLVAWSIFAFAVGNREFIFYAVVMVLLIAAVMLVHLRVRFQVLALWGLSLWGLAHLAGGLLPIPSSWPRLGDSLVLYNLWIVPGILKYDQLVHAYGFGLVTWICWQALERSFASHGITIRPSLGLMGLCVAAGMGFGAANEVVEFAATLLLPGTNVGGYLNTGWDLVANLVGSLAAALLIYFWSLPSLSR